MPDKTPEKSAKAARSRKATSQPPEKSNASRKIDEKIADLGNWRGERLSEIRRIIREVEPGVVEEWKWMGSPTWSRGGVFAVANAHKGKVKLTFAHGAALSDPRKLFNATLGGNTWRAIDFREGDRIDDAALRELVREAVAYSTTQSAKPVVLSGGNPQIAKGDGDTPMQAYIAAMPEWKSDLGRRLDVLIELNAPDVRKAVRWNSPFYGMEGEEWFVSDHVFAKCVRVTFFNGVSLSPVPPGSGKDKDARRIDIYEDALDVEQMASWIRQAAALPGWGGF